MFFFFEYQQLNNIPVIRKAFEMICYKKMLKDGYMDMTEYINGMIQKEVMLFELTSIKSKYKFLYENDIPNMDNVYNFWLENGNNNALTNEKLSFTEARAIINWVYIVLSNDYEKIEFTKDLFSAIKDFNNIDFEIDYKDGVLYNAKKIEIKIVRTLSMFNTAIKSTTSVKGNKIVFRGHSSANYFLLPSIMRKESWLSNEHKIYNEILIECPNYFINYNTHLETLVQMQHYGIPTRLLDITNNPLVALYFACNSNKDQLGEVIVLSERIDNIKYPNSDCVSILSSLPLLTQKDKNDLSRLIECGVSIESFNEYEKTKKLLHEIKTEKPAFQSKIVPDTVKNCYFVYALKNNQRIIKQDGAFIVCGLIEHDIELINSYRYQNKDGKRIIILVKNKDKILKELDKISINDATLFPEIESVANYIKRKYN